MPIDAADRAWQDSLDRVPAFDADRARRCSARRPRRLQASIARPMAGTGTLSRTFKACASPAGDRAARTVHPASSRDATEPAWVRLALGCSDVQRRRIGSSPGREEQRRTPYPECGLVRPANQRELPLRRAQRVREQHRDRHRPDAARHRRDPARASSRAASKSTSPQSLPSGRRLMPTSMTIAPGLIHVARHELRLADRGDDDVGLPHDARAGRASRSGRSSPCSAPSGARAPSAGRRCSTGR